MLILAAPAAAEVWSGWVGIAQKTGFGLVSPLPGIWPSLHLDTAITLPVGVKAYAAYALRAWLSHEQAVSARTRRFAKWSAIFSFALGMAGAGGLPSDGPSRDGAGAVGDHHRRGMRAGLVLGMGTALVDMLRADAETATEPPGNGNPRTGSASVLWLVLRGPGRTGPGPGRIPGTASGFWSFRRDQDSPQQDHDARAATPSLSGIGQARQAASRLIAAGMPVSRRTLRSEGIRGSNQALNDLAGMINAELADTALPARPGNAVV